MPDWRSEKKFRTFELRDVPCNFRPPAGALLHKLVTSSTAGAPLPRSDSATVRILHAHQDFFCSFSVGRALPVCYIRIFHVQRAQVAQHWSEPRGRSIACAGSSSRPLEYYFGATGGGLWKTTDGGTTWRPVTDGQIHSSSVGAVAVAPSNPDVVYIGTGESEIRGNIIQGDGAYKSTDGGKTWTHIGLGETQVISKIRVHPSNPDLVY